jgi:hypothetical protein
MRSLAPRKGDLRFNRCLDIGAAAGEANRLPDQLDMVLHLSSR